MEKHLKTVEEVNLHHLLLKFYFSLTLKFSITFLVTGKSRRLTGGFTGKGMLAIVKIKDTGVMPTFLALSRDSGR